MSHLFADFQVGVVEGVERDGGHFLHVHVSFRVEGALVHAHVDDFPAQDACFRIIVFQLAFHGHGQFVDERGVHEGRFRGMEAGAGELVGHAVAGDEAHVVAGHDLSGLGHAHRESLAGQNVLHRLVPGAEAQADFVHFADAAPCRVHGVGRAVFAVGGDDEHGLGISEGLGPEILSHSRLFSLEVCLSPIKLRKKREYCWPKTH